MPEPTTPSALRTLLLYLFGSREAVLRVAASRSATVLALVLVLSAGLAREYDGENLVAEPWHALRPLGGSIATGTILFLLVHALTWRRSVHRAHGPIESYRRFMTCYWMTAPLAWLYAIPFERFLSPADAVRANLWLLAIVSVWRVLLITRVAAVLYGARPIPMFFIVMAFADAVAFAAFVLIPAPIIDFMGGVQHTERDAILAGVALQMQVLTFLALPLWIIGALIAIAYLKPAPPPTASATPLRGWGILAAASLAIWIIPLAIAQPEQFRRTRVMRHFEAGDIPAALAELSSHPESAYPRRWELPPRTGYGEDTPSLDDIQAAIESQPTAPWVTAQYAAKIARQLRGSWQVGRSWAFARRYLTESDLESVDRLVEHRLIIPAHLDKLAFIQSHDSTLTLADHAAIDDIAAAIREALAAASAETDPAPDAPAPPP